MFTPVFTLPGRGQAVRAIGQRLDGLGGGVETFARETDGTFQTPALRRHVAGRGTAECGVPAGPDTLSVLATLLPGWHRRWYGAGSWSR